MSTNRINFLGTARHAADGPITGRLVTNSTRGFLAAQSIKAPFEDLEPVPVADDTLPQGDKPEGFDAALGTLLRLLLDSDGPPSETAKALAIELSGVCDRIAAHIAEAKAQRAAELRTQLDAVMAEGRDAKAHLDQLRTASGLLRTQRHGLDERLAQASRKLRETLATRPADDTWPTDDELNAWRNRIQEAEAELAEARVPLAELELRIASNENETRRAKARLTALSQQREKLRAQLGAPRVRKFGQ